VDQVEKKTDFVPVRIETYGAAKRFIREDTGQKYNYGIGTYMGQRVHVANYYDEQGKLVGQKLRFQNKDFKVLGTVSGLLFGSNLFRADGKRICITEGEIDALSMSQAQGNKWPVVSIPTGAQGAKKAIASNLNWLEQYEKVVLMFDNDEPGKKAASECAELFSPNKACIATLPLKDANEMLSAGKAVDLINAMWNAKAFRPDGIVSGTAVWDLIVKDDNVEAKDYPWQALNNKTHGLRTRELVTVTAGSGIGKSLVCREIAYHLIQMGERVGYIALEESVKRTALGLLSIALNKPLHINGFKPDEIKEPFEQLIGDDKAFFYDHFGSLDSDNLLNRIRFLHKSCGCRWVVLDHLSIVVSGMDDGDERRLIDRTMTALRSLVEETGMGMILVSHLKRPEGKGHENGAQTSLAQLRGSAAIAQLSDMVIGLERDQQDEESKNITTIRVLKNRFSGETGVAGALRYETDTGRLREVASFGDSEDRSQKDF
jgi:twinkle protein